MAEYHKLSIQEYEQEQRDKKSLEAEKNNSKYTLLPRKRKAREKIEDDAVEEYSIRMNDEERTQVQEFEQRLKERKEKKHEPKAQPPVQEADVGKLREYSRQKYLGQREQQQLYIEKARIKAEEHEFKGQRLTETERRDLEYRKRMVALIEEKQKIPLNVEVYSMPESYIKEKEKKMNNALYGRYQEEKNISEQDNWEANRIKMGVSKRKKEENYEYLFNKEEHIKFEKNYTLAPSEEKPQESIKGMRESLPIYPLKERLMKAIKDYQVLIIVGETGSGKTTQIPQYLREEGYCSEKKIGCTQPRRVAAMSVACRVAQEMKVKLGHEVGYSIRFEDKTSKRTQIKYMTDGMLLREFLNEPDLNSYSVLIIDEAHERSLHTDVLFGLVKDISRYRKDLKLLISSATLDAQKFSVYFDDAPIFNIPGRMYPVDIYYTLTPEPNYLSACIATIMQIHITQDIKGDILCFLTGQEEIDAGKEALTLICKNLRSKIKEMIICPIYSALPSEKQAKIFQNTPPNARKVVLATNVAETSITIDGIMYVVDPGFVKMKTYNPKTSMEALTITPCSRASANQRAGRAGRVGPGKCFRLYTSWTYENELDESTVPEIQRTNLNSVVLLLKSLGINDLVNFDFLDSPPPDTLMRALEQLYALGALNSKGELTVTGRRMAEFPLDPMLSKTILASEKYNCSEEVASIVSMLSQTALFYRPKDKLAHADKARQNFFDKAGDHLTLLNVWNSWVESEYSMQWCYENFIQLRSMNRARDTREQLLKLMERVEVPLISSQESSNVLKSFTCGFFYNTCRIQSLGYKCLKRRNTVHVHPNSSLFKSDAEYLIFHELVLTSKEYMRQVSEINPKWLIEIAPHFYKELEKIKKKPVKSRQV